MKIYLVACSQFIALNGAPCIPSRWSCERPSAVNSTAVIESVLGEAEPTRAAREPQPPGLFCDVRIRAQVRVSYVKTERA